MKVIKLQQNSDEWLEFRKGKSGGSEFKNLWIPGLPLKAKIIERLEQENPLSPEDKRCTVQELAGMLEPSELAELKLEAEPKKHFYEIVADRVARPVTPNDYEDIRNHLLVNGQGGTTFPISAIRNTIDNSKNEIVTIIITDDTCSYLRIRIFTTHR